MNAGLYVRVIQVTLQVRVIQVTHGGTENSIKHQTHKALLI
jgi:hypothetical protein